MNCGITNFPGSFGVRRYSQEMLVTPTPHEISTTTWKGLRECDCLGGSSGSRTIGPLRTYWEISKSFWEMHSRLPTSSTDLLTELTKLYAWIMTHTKSIYFYCFILLLMCCFTAIIPDNTDSYMSQPLPFMNLLRCTIEMHCRCSLWSWMTIIILTSCI